MASVQVRCVDIASRLGCDYLLNVHDLKDVPNRYAAYFCVKPDLTLDGVKRLSKRGKIIWDIIDGGPPPDFVSIYLASTNIASELFASYGRIQVVPHHHCNFGGRPNSPHQRTPAWIGARHWEPKLAGFRYDVHFVEGSQQAEVVSAHRRMGIGLNFRCKSGFMERTWPALLHLAISPQKRLRLERDLYNFHLAVNSGIKLINCLGFGVPSVSGDEPAYCEIDNKCTYFSSPSQCARKVRALMHDDALYMQLRKHCLREAPKYHIDAIVQKYRKLIADL